MAWITNVAVADFDRAAALSVAFPGDEVRCVSLAAAFGHRVCVVGLVLAVASSGALSTVPRVLDVDDLSSIAADLAVVVALARMFARDRVFHLVGIIDVLAFVENLKKDLKKNFDFLNISKKFCIFFVKKKSFFFYLCELGGAVAWISNLLVVGVVVAATFSVAVRSSVVSDVQGAFWVAGVDAAAVAGVVVVATVAGCHDADDLVLWAGCAADIGVLGRQVSVLAVGEGLRHETLGFSAGASGENGGSEKLHCFVVLKSKLVVFAI